MSIAATVDVALNTAALALESITSRRDVGRVELAVARVGVGVLRGAGDLVVSIKDGWSATTPDAVGALVANLICEVKPLAGREAQAKRWKRVRAGWSETAEIVREWFEPETS